MTLDPTPGKTVVEIAHAAGDGSLKGMYVMGENPFLSDPNVARVRDAFCNLDFLVVQDIFLTETAEVADVVLPGDAATSRRTGTYTNTDRRVQLGRTVLDAARRGAPRLADPLRRDDAHGLPAALRRHRGGVRRVRRTSRRTTGGCATGTWTAPASSGPAPTPRTREGTVVLFGDGFPTASGRGTFAPAEVIPPAELPERRVPLRAEHGPHARSTGTRAR